VAVTGLGFSRDEAAEKELQALILSGLDESKAPNPADVVEALPWPKDRRPGACAAALTLLRPMAELLAAEVPEAVKRLLEAVRRLLKVEECDAGQRLPASLAVCLYFKLQLPDEQVAADAPGLLALLGDVGRLAGSASPGSRGSLAFAALLARQLTSRAGAMTDSVLNALDNAAAESPLTNGALAALDLVGGPTRCAACQMQVLTTLFGRSLVVAADTQHVAVLSLDGAADAKAVQWVQWPDLQVPPREVSAVAGVGRASLWGERVVNCLLSAVQQILTKVGVE
jgi:hypothetical protein